MAESLVASLSLQAPQTLRKHLPDLWMLRPNARSTSEHWPWRGATGEDDVRWLVDKLASAPEQRERDRAFECLLESRTTHGIAAALARVGQVDEDDDAIASMFHRVGLERKGKKVTPLCSEATHHVVFPPGFLQLPRGIGDTPGAMLDPTWRLDGRVVTTGRFGGTADGTCGFCGGTLHRLLRLEDAIFPVARTGGPIELVTCLSCLSSEPVLFFDHRKGIRSLGATRRTPESRIEPLPESPVTLVVTPPRWRLQDWAHSNGRESLHRVGGEPTWIQDAEFPACPRCDRAMRFIAQLDSMDFADGRECAWGIAYLFWCSKCLISASRMQDS
jgi:hypothetical protein